MNYGSGFTFFWGEPISLEINQEELEAERKVA